MFAHTGQEQETRRRFAVKVGAEERKPENDERQEHPDECPLRSTLPAVDFHPSSAAETNWTSPSAAGPAADR